MIQGNTVKEVSSLSEDINGEMLGSETFPVFIYLFIYLKVQKKNSSSQLETDFSRFEHVFPKEDFILTCSSSSADH